MPAQISSILDGPAGPPPPAPAIDKPSLRRLAAAISALPDTRLSALSALLVAAGVPEHDATLDLDLEALPVRVFRKVWHCVFDLAPAPEPAPAARRSVVVAEVRDGSDPPVIKHEAPAPAPAPAPPRPYAYRHSTYNPSDNNEDDELQEDDDLVPTGPSVSTPPVVPTKRRPPSSRSGKQKRRASSVSSRSDASGNSQREYRFVHPAPHPQAGPSTSTAPVSASSTVPPTAGSPQAGSSKVQWVQPQRLGIACQYRSPIPDFAPCTRTFSRVADMRRHIDHQHCEEEAQAVIDGRITRAQATLLGDDWKGKINKPTCEGCGQTFSRKDAVKRHQTETGAKVIDGVCLSCPGSGNGSAAGKKRARRK